VQDEGSALPQRGFLNFVGAGVTATDDAANNRTTITLATMKYRATHTFALVGDVSAITGMPSFFVSLIGSQTAVLYGIRADIASGTSVGVQVVKNGTNVGGVITVTPTTATTTLGSVALADNDELTIVLSAPVGTPTNLGVSLIIEHTVGLG
jgi:hypothetical protein